MKLFNPDQNKFLAFGELKGEIEHSKIQGSQSQDKTSEWEARLYTKWYTTSWTQTNYRKIFIGWPEGEMWLEKILVGWSIMEKQQNILDQDEDQAQIEEMLWQVVQWMLETPWWNERRKHWIYETNK